MRKLLYTLLIGALIVACDKDMYEGDLIPMSVEQEAADEFDVMSLDFDGMISRLVASAGKQVKSASTAKTVSEGSYITIYTGVQENYLYEIGFGDDVTFCENNLELTKLSLVRKADKSVDIFLGDSDGTLLVNVDVDLDEVFAIDALVSGTRIHKISRLVSTAAVSGNVFTF